MTNYDTTYGVHTSHPGCRIVVRFDTTGGRLDRFVVQLQRTDSAATGWETLAQIDHAPEDPNGHDVYSEGIHVDVYLPNGPEITIWPRHGPLPRSSGALLRICADYLETHIDWFRAVAAGDRESDDPPVM